MKVLLDLNVVLDVFLNRVPWVVDSAAVLQANHTGLVQGCLSAPALTTLFYIVRKQVDRQRAFEVIDECLKAFELIPVDLPTIMRARSIGGKDFEDDLQIACAVEGQVVAIVTRDAKGLTHGPIPTLSPVALLQRLAATQL
jgi:predicted nucleic acid-binding protein